jgi:hypothetical protein
MEALVSRMPAAGLVGTVKAHSLIAVTDLHESTGVPTAIPPHAGQERDGLAQYSCESARVPQLTPWAHG